MEQRRGGGGMLARGGHSPAAPNGLDLRALLRAPPALRELQARAAVAGEVLKPRCVAIVAALCAGLTLVRRVCGTPAFTARRSTRRAPSPPYGTETSEATTRHQ